MSLVLLQSLHTEVLEKPLPGNYQGVSSFSFFITLYYPDLLLCVDYISSLQPFWQQGPVLL